MRSHFEHVLDMVKRIPTETRRRVVELYVLGYNYREINNETKVSLGAISSIINEACANAPDLEDLRELNTDLIQAGASLTDALRGATLIEKLNELDVSMDRIQSCIGFLNKYGEDAGSVLEWGLRLSDLERSWGMSYDQIVLSVNEMAERLQEQTKLYKNLISREETLRKSMPEIEQLKALKDKMSCYKLTTEHLDGFIECNLRLEELGFTRRAAELLASKLKKLGLDPMTAANRLSNLLSRHIDLEHSVSEMTERRDRLQRDISNMKIQKEEAENDLKILREQVTGKQRLSKRLEDHYLLKEKLLDEDYNTKKKELEEERKDIEKEIQKMKREHASVQESLDEAKETLAEIEKRLEEIKPLATLVSITNEPKTPIASASLKDVLGFIEALRTQAGVNPLLTTKAESLRLHLDAVSRMIKERMKT